MTYTGIVNYFVKNSESAMNMNSKRQNRNGSLIRSITVLALVITVMASSAQGVAMCFSEGCSAAVAGSGSVCACIQQGDHCGISEDIRERLLAGCNCTHLQFDLDKAIAPCDASFVNRLPTEKNRISLFTIRLHHLDPQAGPGTVTGLCAGPGPILCHIQSVVLLT